MVERFFDCASSGKRCVQRRWAAVLNAFDASATAILWAVCASTFVRFWIFPGTSAETFACAASTFVFLTFAAVGVYALRETLCVWRERPFWLPPSEFRNRVASASAPLGTAAFVVLTTLWTRGAASLATCCVAAVYVVAVDAFAGRFARRWGATVARDWFGLSETPSCDALLISTHETETSNVGTDEPAGVCVASVVDVCELDESDGETLATQRRVRAEDGGTRILGSVAVEFEGDAEVAPVFVAFCPPFEGVPSFEFEQIAGPEVVVKTTSVQPFGVRLEAKRRTTQTLESQEIANDEKIRIEYFAAFPPFDEAEDAAF